MEDIMTLHQILEIIRKRWKFITSVVVFLVLAAAIISYFLIKPVYQASTQILVNQKEPITQLDVNKLNSNVEMIKTYSVIVKSPVILEKVIEDLDLSLSLEQLSGMIEVSNQEESQIFMLTVDHSSAKMAVTLANAVSEMFQNEIPNIMNIDNVSILAKAQLPADPVPVKPKPLLNIAAALAAGLFLGSGGALLLEYLDKTVKDEQDVEALLGLPLLGTIRKVPKKKNKLVKSQPAKRGESIGF